MSFQSVLFRKRSTNGQVFLLGFVLTLANLAAVVHKSSRVYLFQQSQCLAFYMTVDPTKIDPQNGVKEALCKVDVVQSRLSVTDGLDSFLSNLPGRSLCHFIFIWSDTQSYYARLRRSLRSTNRYANNCGVQ